MKKIFLLILSCMLLTTVLTAQVNLETYGVSPRGAAVDTTDVFDLAYNGLQNVGIQTKIYLKGSSSLALVSPSWVLDSKPALSAADLGTASDMDTSSQINTLTPDVAGTYTVIFTNDGAADTITINAGTYIGSAPACKGCHNNANFDFVYDKWEGTGHATALVRGLNGLKGDHFGPNCVSCHSTGNDPNASNDGFDDFPFVFPDTLFVGQYDNMLAAYPDAMKLANIQCESCHGPGSEHAGSYGDTQNSKMVVTLDVKNCAVCHDSGTHHGFPDQWEHSGDDATEFDGRGFEGGHAKGAYVGYAGGRNGCSPCHSGAGYVQWVKEGRPVDADGLPAATAVLPTATNISCAVCHDPHDASKEHQLRQQDTQLGDGTPITFAEYGTGSQCMECHRSRRVAATYANDIKNQSSHYGPHHGPQADMLIGANAPDYGIAFPSSPHATATENACVDCHMSGTLTDADGNINHVGGHSFNMNDAEGNDHVEACAQCHGSQVGSSFTEKKYYINGSADLDGNGTSEGLQLEVKGLLEELAAFLPKDNNGAVSIVGDSTSLTPAIMRGGYVYMFVEEDRSFGIHNPAFTVGMLKAAIDELGGVTGINYAETEVPQEYKLSQNYPNPFNPTTVINFSLPEAGNVKIAVYDALGREVELLVDQKMDAGNHDAHWNATKYSAGVYFYNIKVNNFVSTKKMVLLK